MHTPPAGTGWRERALAVMPVGSSTNSKAPTLLPEEPEVIVRGRGCSPDVSQIPGDELSVSHSACLARTIRARSTIGAT